MNSFLGNKEVKDLEVKANELIPRQHALRIPRWRVALTATLAGVLIHLALLVIFIGLGSFASHDTYAGLSGAGYALAHDGEGGGGDTGDNSGPGHDGEERWVGTILSFPPTLIGIWTITIGEDEQISVVATAETRFDPDRATAFAVGSWVEVRAQKNDDGIFIAERIRVDEYEDGEIIVRLQDASYLDAIVNEFDVTLTSTVLSSANIYLFTTDEGVERDLVERIAGAPGVIWAEVNYVNSVPEDDGYKTWGWGGIEEPAAYVNQHAYQQIHWGIRNRVYDGDGVVVAVMDTGVYASHEQFVGKLQLPSLDVISDDNDPSDEGPGLAWGHGTHVAGVIAAMAPRAKILPVRVLDRNGRGNTFLLAYAIEWAIQQPGVQVINLSLGTDFDSRILRDVIARATEQGIVVVAAAGNNATSALQYPAAYANVIAVTAVDEASQKATFANYGKEWVDLAAPGVGIMSTMISEQGAGYASWSGTSMATAFVSGAAVLVAEQVHGAVSTTGGIVEKLLETGTTLDVLNPLFAGQIGRLLDVSAALDIEEIEEQTVLFIPLAERAEQ